MAAINFFRLAGSRQWGLLAALIAIGMALGVGLVALAIVRDQSPQFIPGLTKRNLRMVAIAVHSAHDAHKKLPPFAGPYGGKDSGTFHYHLLPFMEQEHNWDVPVPKAIVRPFLVDYDLTWPENDGRGVTNFVVNLRLFYSQGGLGELHTGDKLIYLKWDQVTRGDGLSNTLLFSTKYQRCGNGGSLWFDPNSNALNSPTAATFGANMAPWQRAPKQEDCDPTAGTAVSFRGEFIAVGFCDGSVTSISTKISPTIWKALHTPSGGPG